MTKPRHRLATSEPLATGKTLTLEGNAAHYLTTVLRMQAGEAIALFNRTDGEWRARLTDIRKREVILTVEEQLRPPAPCVGLTVCFAPIKGGRLETIIEKATELGASVLQPVLTARTIVDKVNLERAESIAREAAEQCERTDWPEIREPIKLLKLLGDWPADQPLIYGDESGDSPSVNELLSTSVDGHQSETGGEPRSGGSSRAMPSSGGKAALKNPARWAVLIGPEGGFTPDEFAALHRVNAAHGVSLGPRILRADTAVITLSALTLAAWGDWHSRPRFQGA